jgi:hypothetical protein
MSVLGAARSGDEVQALEAMRDKLAEAMDDSEPAVVAQIAGRLESVLRRLGELRPAGKVTLNDALAERRARRVGGSKPERRDPWGS